MGEKHLNENFLKFLSEELNVDRHASFLLAISGGVDSMVMMHVFRQLGLHFSVAHMNFSLRGKESDLDQALVEDYCNEYQIKCLTKKVNTKNHAKKGRLSTQMAARELRYAWFEELVSKNGYDYLCTAHHLDDSYETAIYNFIKGTGITGVGGIAPKRDYIIRPMLFLTKTDILELAQINQLKWREDQSNMDDYYSRNYIRHHIIPAFKEVNPSAIHTFKDTSERLRGSKLLLERFISELASKAIEKIENGLLIRKFIFLEFHKAEQSLILSYVLDPYGFNYRQISEIISGMGNQSGKQFYSEKYVLLNDRETMILSPLNVEIEEKASISLQKDSKSFEFAGTTFSVSIIHRPEMWRPDYSRKRLQLDLSKLEFPLTIRSWKEGDVFTPMGLKGKKKVSDFMIDRKIPINLKPNIPVLFSNGEIIALVGFEIAERVKITDSTKEIFEIEEIYV